MNGQERKEEKWALNILKKLYPEELSNLEIKDRPDIQDENKKIGIEVTIACMPKEKAIQQAIHPENKHGNSSLDVNKSTNQDRVKKIVARNAGVTLVDGDGECFGFITESCHNQAGDLLKEAVDKKQKCLVDYAKDREWSFIDLFIVNQLVCLNENDFKKKCWEMFRYYCDKYSQEIMFRKIYVFKYGLCGDRLLQSFDTNSPDEYKETIKLSISDEELMQ